MATPMVKLFLNLQMGGFEDVYEQSHSDLFLCDSGPASERQMLDSSKDWLGLGRTLVGD